MPTCFDHLHLLLCIFLNCLASEINKPQQIIKRSINLYFVITVSSKNVLPKDPKQILFTSPFSCTMCNGNKLKFPNTGWWTWKLQVSTVVSRWPYLFLVEVGKAKGSDVVLQRRRIVLWVLRVCGCVSTKWADNCTPSHSMIYHISASEDILISVLRQIFISRSCKNAILAKFTA